MISVTDKTNIEKIAKVLDDYNIEILSTGGTANFLKENAIPVKDVSDETNFPEILNGRVKTLHPKIHGGILSRRDNSVHIDQLQKHHIQEIDLLIINLYKFKETLKNNKDEIEIIENIDSELWILGYQVQFMSDEMPDKIRKFKSIDDVIYALNVV